MLYLLMYLVTGLIIIYAVALCHLIRAEMKGYAAIDYWSIHKHEIFSQGNKLVFPFIGGLLIWPARLVNMIVVIIPDCYDVYERKGFM